MASTERLVGRRVCTTGAYTRAYADPLELAADECVTVVAHDTEWPDYVWCTNAAGRGGWVPVAYLTIRGAIGQALRAYRANELSVIVGEKLIPLDEAGSWYWAESAAGERGWVPGD